MGGNQKKARVKWKILIKTLEEGGTGIQDPIRALNAAKSNMLKKIVTRDRQPWMRWIERKLIVTAIRWKVDIAMSTKPRKKQRRELRQKRLTESALKSG